jgi:hypothetical protein
MQRVLVLIFVALVLAIPFWVGDVFPSTTAARFRDPLPSYCQFRVFDPQGRELPPAAFGLQRNFTGLPVGLGAGRLPPASLNRMGMGAVDEATAVPSADEVRAWVQQRWTAAAQQCVADGDPPWSHVEVRVQVFGPVGQRIDVIRAFQVIVFTPAGAA